ncbi:MAG: hypothetical protein ABSB76_40935 [Streptosporangiaceae bacterium]
MTSFTYRHCDSLDAGLSSPEGHAAAGDVPNFATGGVTMFVAHD